MDYDIRKYLKVYDNVFTPDFCAEIINQLETAPWEQHYYYNSFYNDKQHLENDVVVSYLEFLEKQKVQQELWSVIKKYIVDDFGKKWFGSWAAYSPCRFHKYVTGTKMKNHCDHIHSLFDGQMKGVPILSVIGSLNDDYKGGELVFWEDEVVELKAGQVMIFPSNFLYPHEVRTVLEGNRYSFVSWVW